MEFEGRARAAIDLGALRDNFRLAKLLAKDSRMVAVVKANAYGHGLIQAAETLDDEADMLAVTDIAEAHLLKATLNPRSPILVMQGIIQRREIKALKVNFELVVHSLEQLALLDEMPTQPDNSITFWLKMDSGMGRLGIAPGDYAAAWRKLAARYYTDEIIMMTHLANASLPDSPLNQQQLETFNNVKKSLGGVPTSIPSSAGILMNPGMTSDWARPGIMLYGSSPFPFELEALRAERLGLKPVMTLRSKLIAVKDLKAGDNVGYCSQFICPRDMRIGIACIGYADGYPSNAPNGTPVLVNGHRTGTVGRVSMDMLAVDLSQLPDARLGDPVTLWGRGLSIDEVAAATGIISYNLMCNVNQRRVQFDYHD